MAIALVAHGAAGSADINTVTTPSLDTSGANLTAFWISWYATGAGSVVDSKSNTYTGLTTQTTGAFYAGRWWYVLNPTVGAAHTATFDQAGSYPSGYFLAFSGVKTVSAFDQQNGATSSTSPISTGSITPGEDNELVLAGLGSSTTGAFSIDNGFTIADSLEYAASAYVGGAAAYKIQTTAAAVNPAWTQTNGNLAAAIASFKAAAGAAFAVKPNLPVNQAVQRASNW